MNMSSLGFLDDFAKMILAYCNTAVDNLLPPVLALMSVILMLNIITIGIYIGVNKIIVN